ncbi:MAG: hypothetical protein CMJ13_03050 [Pelagibacterales bacterium]|nr:hypothetical protein [Pelagibacterales bacterium]
MFLGNLKMGKFIIIKIIFSLVLLFSLLSCSKLTPKSANEYTVTKKTPLVMPPDMNMTPPSNEKQKSFYNKKRISKKINDFNIENILTGELTNKNKIIKRKKNKVNKKIEYKNKLNRKKLVKTILRMKESVILK